MNTNHKLGAVREIALVGRLLRATVIATAVFALAFVVAPYIIAEANAANDVSSTISWSAIDLTLDPDVDATDDAADPDAEQALATHGNVEFGDIVPTAKNTTDGDYGTLKVQRKTIGVTTRGKYYTVFLSMEGSNQNLNLTYNNTTDTNIKIAKTSGTWTTPVTLATNGTSGWGYMVPGSVISGGFSSLTQSGMRGVFTESKLDTALYRADGSAYTESLWAAVPASTAPQQIWKNTTSSNSGFSSRDTFDVYYGVNVDTDVLSGTYQNRVIYTALASAASLDEVSYNLVRTVKYGTSGDTETLYFDLAQIGTPVTEGKLSVKMVPHSAMVTARFNPATVDMTGALTCGIVADSFESVTATTNGGSTSKVNCTVPAGTVAPATASGTGAYDFVLEIDGFGYKYVSKINDGAEPGFVYAGLQSVDANGNKYVQNMQDMTAGVCENTNRWNNGLGTAARLYSPSASTAAPDTTTDITNTMPSTHYDSTNNVVIASNTTADGVGSFALKDTRDGKRYVVRRLADGNCWMAQNLNLDLYTGMTLTSEDTNLTSKDTWVLTSSTTNNEKGLGSTQNYDNLSWVPSVGSASTAWQTTHGVESVTLTRYTYDGSTWQPSIVAQCSDGTSQAPCFTISKSGNYYKDVNGVETAVTTAMLEADEKANAKVGFNDGLYYAKMEYQVRKVTNAVGAAWTSKNIGYDSTDPVNNKNVENNSATCTIAFYKDHLKSNEACVVTTTGDAMLTQFDNMGMNGRGYVMTNVTKMADNTTTISGIDLNITNSRAQLQLDGSGNVYYPMASTGADYGWELNGRDGVHALDWGPVYYNPGVNQNSPTTSFDNYGNGSNCASIGAVSGTLKPAGSNTPYSFTSCMDGTQALADTRVDGNWYNWYAAVAGSKITSFSNERAADSICPKGWELPKDSSPENNALTTAGMYDPSFYTLLTTNTSRLATFLSIDQAVAAKKTYALDNNTDGGDIHDYALHAFPLSYVRSGYYNWYSGGLSSRGSRGLYWSAATYNTLNSRFLNFNASGLNPRLGGYEGSGFAVRCVAAQ